MCDEWRAPGGRLSKCNSITNNSECSSLDNLETLYVSYLIIGNQSTDNEL